jgi:hypothetical protein
LLFDKDRHKILNVLKQNYEKSEEHSEVTPHKSVSANQVNLTKKSEFKLKRQVSQKLLTKLTKFELLACGFKKSNELKSNWVSSRSSSDLLVAPSQSQPVTQPGAIHTEQILEQEEGENQEQGKMKTFKKLREFRSKSFGCEKELRKQITNNRDSSIQKKPTIATCKVKDKKIKNKKSEIPFETNKQVESRQKEKIKDQSESKQLVNEKKLNEIFKLVDVDNLHFIDDEVESSLTLEMKKPQFDEDYNEDDYEENGDLLTVRRSSRLGHKKNNFERILNGEDFDLFLSDNTINIISDKEDQDGDESNIDEDWSTSEEFSKCQSAPILTQSKSLLSSNDKKNSFVYDMNLYDEKTNLLSNNRDQMHRLLTDQQATKYVLNGANKLNESSYLSPKIQSPVKEKTNSLEPFIIKDSLTNVKITPTTTNTTLDSLKVKSKIHQEGSHSADCIESETNNDLDEKLPLLSSSSTVISAAKKIKQIEKDPSIIRRSQIDSESLTGSTSSTSSASVSECSVSNSLHTTVTTNTNNSIFEHHLPENIHDPAETFDNDDENEMDQRSSINKEQRITSPNQKDSSQQDETNSLFDDVSQISETLKHNYIQAKRERQLEQQVAELEKLRLQEILDICMEFERQEKLKGSSLSNSSSTSSSLSPPSSLSINKTACNEYPTSAYLLVQSKTSEMIKTDTIKTASLDSSLFAMCSSTSKNAPPSECDKQNSPISRSSSSSASSSSASVNEQKLMNSKELKTLPTLNHIINANKQVSFQIEPSNLEVSRSLVLSQF